MKKIYLAQGTPEWHAYRFTHGNSSNAALLMGEQKYGPQTWAALFDYYQGIELPAPPEFITGHGHKYEEAARVWLEEQTGHTFAPCVVESADGFLSASLDGVEIFDGKIGSEIKVPYKGRNSETWKAICNGDVPRYYWWQIQQQIYCANLDRVIFCVCIVENDEIVEGRTLIVERDNDAIAKLVENWGLFKQMLDAGQRPEDDVAVRDDQEWTDLAQAYIGAKRDKETAEARMDELKEQIRAAANGRKSKGQGINVLWRAGKANWFIRDRDAAINKLRAAGRDDLVKPVETITDMAAAIEALKAVRPDLIARTEDVADLEKARPIIADELACEPGKAVFVINEDKAKADKKKAA